MKILFVARNDGSDTRITKTCHSLVRLGHKVVFAGWDRSPNDQKTVNLAPEIKRRIFVWQAGFGELSSSGWPQFYSHLVRCLREERPQAVHCMNEYPAVMLLPFKGIWYRHLVVDVYDSLAARRFSSPFLRAAAWAVRSLANKGADRIIETSEQLQAMLGPYAKKSIVIFNGPHDPGEDLAFNFPTGPVKVHVGGGLSRRRERLDTLLKALNRLAPGKVQIQASGWLFDDYAKNVFVNHPSVHYRWIDSLEEVVVQAAKCDAMLYLRGDASDSEYRSWVLPNRLFIAMSVGRPIIMGRDAKISQWVLEQQLGYVCPPEDDERLADILRTLEEQRACLPEFAKRARQLFVGQYAWEKMEHRLQILYQDLEESSS